MLSGNKDGKRIMVEKEERWMKENEIQMGKWVIHISRETHSPEVRAHSPSSSFSVLRSTRRTIT